MKRELIIAGCAGLLAIAGQAVAVSYTTLNGSPHVTTAISTFDTYGDMMDGMNVTVVFSDGSVDSAVWGTTGGNEGAAVGTDWSLYMSGHTFDSPWTLLNNSSSLSIMKITLDGQAGDTLFDMVDNGVGGDEMTPDSARGRPLTVVSGPDAGVAVTYTDILSLAGDPLSPYGDVYVTLIVDFSGVSGLGAQSSWEFIQDTDNAAIPGDIRQLPDGGATILLAGLALTGIGLLRRK